MIRVPSSHADRAGHAALVVMIREGKGFAVRIARNRIEGGNWIGVRLRGSAVGATIHVGARQKAAIVTGESFASQRSNSRTFGLGDKTEVGFISVRWPDGRTSRIDRPAINRYHVFERIGR